MYKTYQTDGFVLAAKNIGEGNRLFYLFTEDLGLVQAYAQNIRSEKSKLRYQLQALSRVQVSLVRGREYWRVVGVEDTQPLFWNEKFLYKETIIMQKIFNLILRLVRGEEAHQVLFAIISNFFVSLNESGKESDSVLHHKHIELLTVARILHSLGYVSSRAPIDVLFTSEQIRAEDIEVVASNERYLLKTINTAFHESHL